MVDKPEPEASSDGRVGPTPAHGTKGWLWLRALHQPDRIVVTRPLPEHVMDRLRSSYVSWINPEDRTLSARELQPTATKLPADVLLVMATDRLDA